MTGLGVPHELSASNGALASARSLIRNVAGRIVDLLSTLLGCRIVAADLLLKVRVRFPLALYLLERGLLFVLANNALVISALGRAERHEDRQNDCSPGDGLCRLLADERSKPADEEGDQRTRSLIVVDG